MVYGFKILLNTAISNEYITNNNLSIIYEHPGTSEKLNQNIFNPFYIDLKYK